MNRSAMVAPFAEEELQQFAGRGGKTMTYIEDETVMDRLDVGYGYGNWQIQVDEARADGVVKVRLGVRESGEWTWFEDFGYPNREGGESLKEAVSDGIRRCGRYLGIARDLYRKTDPARTDTPERGPRQHPGLVNGDPKPPDRPPLIRETGNDGLIGKVATSGTQDFELRETPDGWVLPFRLKEGAKAGQIVIAHDDLAQALRPFRDTIMGERVTVWGRYSDEESPPKADGFVVRYKVLHLERIQTADWTMPSQPGPVETLPEPMFPDEDEAAAILAAEMAEAAR